MRKGVYLTLRDIPICLSGLEKISEFSPGQFGRSGYIIHQGSSSFGQLIHFFPKHEHLRKTEPANPQNFTKSSPVSHYRLARHLPLKE
jgi:hypothetical protein